MNAFSTLNQFSEVENTIIEFHICIRRFHMAIGHQPSSLTFLFLFVDSPVRYEWEKNQRKKCIVHTAFAEHTRTSHTRYTASSSNSNIRYAVNHNHRWSAKPVVGGSAMQHTPCPAHGAVCHWRYLFCICCGALTRCTRTASTFVSFALRTHERGSAGRSDTVKILLRDNWNCFSSDTIALQWQWSAVTAKSRQTLRAHRVHQV